MQNLMKYKMDERTRTQTQNKPLNRRLEFIIMLNVSECFKAEQIANYII